MSRRRTPEDWRRAVFRAHHLGDPVRVLLLFLADHMKDNRTVSVKRDVIAKALGKSERRISERVAAAHDAGFLSTVAPGYRGHVAVYQGTFPEAESVTPTSTLSSAETRPLSTRERVTPGGPTTTTADLSVGGADRHVGSKRQAEGRPVRDWLTDCRWHTEQPCPEDCANHPDTRRRSA
jgi:hypothetical protein